ncbi:neuronal acetylcholine receptor subunit alpha-2-like [Halichoeres trimaculatus]|uniref:neuronal acetylcholine receptor subunit alpha-2-like n=1 Tax=Halichoeres trimaculatus TaxID=147232 RepID=UPI003D9DF5CD
MIFAGLLFLLLLTGGISYNHTEPPDGEGVYNQSHLDPGGHPDSYTEPPDKQYTQEGDLPSHCAYANMVNHFNLTDKVKFYQTRPTKNYLRATNVELTNNDKLFQTSYITVIHDGQVHQWNGIVLVTTCKMQFYRFPFDTQICNLTFRSIQQNVDEIKLHSGLTSEKILEESRRWMKTESEWLLMNVTVETKEVYNFDFYLSVLVYTVTIKRRSVLYVANFIVPILFFLCLDLASFLISESGGEKLSFKVTVLLAVTVMQLILNDILPSSSDRIPLIAVYCIGVFTLMMLSLLETILMMYLMEKDNVSQDKEADKDQSLGEDCRDQQGRVQNCFREVNKSIPCVRVFDKSPGEKACELLPEVKEGSSSQLTEQIHDFESLSNELKEISLKMSLLLSSRKEEEEPGGSSYNHSEPFDGEGVYNQSHLDRMYA